jgi:hypothetical protein
LIVLPWWATSLARRLRPRSRGLRAALRRPRQVVARMLDNYGMSTIRKRKLDQFETAGNASGALDLTRLATIAYSSEDPAHPVEHLFDGQTGPGSSRWAAAQADTVERIVIEFDRPQSVARLVYEVEETQYERTQEVHVEVSSDGGRSYRRVVVQEYTFSPHGATFQREDLRLESNAVTHLRLMVVPNKRGSGIATLTSLSVYP